MMRFVNTLIGNLCRCTGYESQLRGVRKFLEGRPKIMNKHIGKSYDKVDSKGILTGKPSYTGDFVPKDALVIKVLRSPHAQARIKSIDTSKAKLIPGVEAIFTHEDVPNTRFTLAGQTYPEPSAYDALILDPVVRYVGDEVALVVAKDEATALKAMPLIKVEYEVQKTCTRYAYGYRP